MRRIYSSRRLADACLRDVGFMLLTGRARPDYHTIGEFRQRFTDELVGLFAQVLRLCQEAGLVRLGHISLDGTKVRANASKHKAMSYGRMLTKAEMLEAMFREKAVAKGEDPEEARVPERAQTNFTDPESRIMKTPEGFQQCYNAQAAADAGRQVVVACDVTNHSPDVQQ